MPTFEHNAALENAAMRDSSESVGTWTARTPQPQRMKTRKSIFQIPSPVTCHKHIYTDIYSSCIYRYLKGEKDIYIYTVLVQCVYKYIHGTIFGIYMLHIPSDGHVFSPAERV